jgi:hypothetical protein
MRWQGDHLVVLTLVPLLAGQSVLVSSMELTTFLSPGSSLRTGYRPASCWSMHWSMETTRASQEPRWIKGGPRAVCAFGPDIFLFFNHCLSLNWDVDLERFAQRTWPRCAPARYAGASPGAVCVLAAINKPCTWVGCTPGIHWPYGRGSWPLRCWSYCYRHLALTSL